MAASNKYNGVVLAVFESRSSESMHQVRLAKDGKIYCTCRGWIYNKRCWHLDEVEARRGEMIDQGLLVEAQ